MKNTVIGRARCPHCGYITSTGGITEHIKHCSKNPDVIAKKRQKVVPTEVSFDSLPKHLQDFLALPIESPTSTGQADWDSLEDFKMDCNKCMNNPCTCTPPTAHTEELSREGDLISIDELFSAFKRYGIDTTNWDGDEGAEQAIALGVKNLLAEQSWQPTQPVTREGEVMVKPKVVCYCGSLRVAMEAFKKAEYDAVIKGEIALLPCCMFIDIQREYGAESDYKQKADEVHKRKIDICDEVFVLNVGGYIGESTRNEINYATKVGKPIIYLENYPIHQHLLNNKS